MSTTPTPMTLDEAVTMFAEGTLDVLGIEAVTDLVWYSRHVENGRPAEGEAEAARIEESFGTCPLTPGDGLLHPLVIRALEDIMRRELGHADT